MSDDNDNEEIERISRKKMEQLMKSQSSVAQKRDTEPVTLTDSNFSSEISRHELMVVDFWAAWCGPCRIVSPVIEQLASEYAGRVTFGKLNVDENPVISNQFVVQSIPTILVFKGGRQVDEVVGAVPKARIESKFKPYLENGDPNSMYD